MRQKNKEGSRGVPCSDAWDAKAEEKEKSERTDQERQRSLARREGAVTRRKDCDDGGVGRTESVEVVHALCA